MTQIERRRALAESLQDVIDHPMRRASDIKAANETARQESNQRRRMVTGGLLLLTWGVLGWLWLARPDWAFNPPLGLVAEVLGRTYHEAQGKRPYHIREWVVGGQLARSPIADRARANEV